MSAPEAAPLALGRCALDVVELIARDGRAPLPEGDPVRPLPALGCVGRTEQGLAAGVQPARWLLIGSSRQSSLARRYGAHALLIARGSGLRALWLSGSAHRDLLAHGCRLDLAGSELSPWRAAATLIAQTPVTLLALPRGMLLLAPASLEQHLYEWLRHSAHGIAPVTEREVAFPELSGD